MTAVLPENMFAMFISYAYLATCIFFLGDIIYSLGEKDELIWKRRDLLGMMVCVLGIPVCIGVISIGMFKSIPSMLNWGILGLIFGGTILWTILQYLNCNDEKARTELCNTAHNGMLIVTMIGILQTDMPDNYFKVLFVIMGCGLLIIQEVFQNKKIN